MSILHKCLIKIHEIFVSVIHNDIERTHYNLNLRSFFDSYCESQLNGKVWRKCAENIAYQGNSVGLRRFSKVSNPKPVVNIVIGN